MSKTDAVETDILNLFVGKATTIFTTTPITPYIALYTVTPTDSAAGTEVSGSSYARQNVAAASWTLSGTSPTTANNNAAVNFPVVTSSAYTVVGCGLCTAVTAGTLLRWQTITGVALNVGDNGQFAVNAIAFTED
jgi:hypothetical protein